MSVLSVKTAVIWAKPLREKGGFEAGRAGEGRFDRNATCFSFSIGNDGATALTWTWTWTLVTSGTASIAAAVIRAQPRPPRDAVHKMATELENNGPPRFQGGCVPFAQHSPEKDLRCK